ncbi:leucine-rich repeat protein [Perkinsela sp. CCAP 1560/4]|nr:leucine-rich repeat protein [Perkinsela sp. CCAP 1560/4]|eukprot:KNH07186.1 leucine-rich repeat protein [Perkinsela sp. CCAP 1560/4]
MFPSCFLSIDPVSIARPDKDSMLQQTLMEILVGDFDDKTCFRDSDGDFEAVCAWEGVDCSKHGEIDFDGDFEAVCAWEGVDCSENCEIRNIDWQQHPNVMDLFGDADGAHDDDVGPVRCGGSIDLRWVPSTVEKLSIPDLCLSGSVDTSVLPREMFSIQLKGNTFSGTFSTAALPPKIRTVDVSKNRLCGSLDLARGFLPERIYIFRVSHNEFSGSVDLSSLPVSLKELWLNANRLSGSIDLRSLPGPLQKCYLEQNEFQQDVVVFPDGKWGSAHVILDNGRFQSFVDTRGIKVRTSASPDGQTVSLFYGKKGVRW